MAPRSELQFPTSDKIPAVGGYRVDNQGEHVDLIAR